jgi:hypothetical protein
MRNANRGERQHRETISYYEEWWLGSHMTYLLLKAVVSGIIVVIVSEVARRSPGVGALIASLPLISVLAVIWLWRDTGDAERIASHLHSTFWYVLPSLPMFIVMPMLLRIGMPFWASLAYSCALTMVLYLAMIWLLPKFGISV